MEIKIEECNLSDIITRLSIAQKKLQKLPLNKERHKLYATYASLEGGLKKLQKNIKN